MPADPSIVRYLNRLLGEGETFTVKITLHSGPPCLGLELALTNVFADGLMGEQLTDDERIPNVIVPFNNILAMRVLFEGD